MTLTFRDVEMTRDDRQVLLDDSFSGMLTVGAETCDARRGGSDTLPLDIRLKGALQVRNGCIEGGSVAIIHPSGRECRRDVSAGFVLPRLVAAFCGTCPRPEAVLPRAWIASWPEGGQPTALLRFDPDGGSLSLVLSATMHAATK